MQQVGSDSRDCVEWARRVNSHWIVHHGLKESTNAYLNQLEAGDPERLVRSCERARQLVRVRASGEDPKPWFYAGQLSLATLEEARKFLKGHWFTAACLPGLPSAFQAQMEPEDVGSETREKAQRIREAVAGADTSH